MTITGQIRDEFIVEKQGKKFVLAPGLVDAAHRAFKSLSIVSTLIQYGNDENANTWICSTKVECDNGTYVQLGDASPRNTSSAMLGVLPRLAETRSVSRALRLAVNAGVLAIFDDPDEDDEPRPVSRRPERVEPPASPPPFAEPSKPIQRAEPTLAPAPGPPRVGAPSFPPAKATEPQIRAIFASTKAKGMSERDADTDALLKYGATVAELSLADASAYIKLLNAKEVVR
jgi:hypothetical protein